MLSGIGDGAELARHGITVAHDLPGVGRNLQDHIDYTLTYRSKNRDLFGVSPSGLTRLFGKEVGRYRHEGRGMVTSNFAEAGGFLRTDPKLDVPDIQLHFVVGMVDDLQILNSTYRIPAAHADVVAEHLWISGRAAILVGPHAALPRILATRQSIE